MGKFLKAQYPENQIFSEQTILGLFLVELRFVGLFIIFSAVATRRLRVPNLSSSNLTGTCLFSPLTLILFPYPDISTTQISTFILYPFNTAIITKISLFQLILE